MMSRQQSPFAALTGAEKQIRWLEYQSVRLPYVDAPLDQEEHAETKHAIKQTNPPSSTQHDRPQPPPEVPRTIPTDYYKTRHSQYDAVIARLKQAELQTRRSASQPAQQ